MNKLKPMISMCARAWDVLISLTVVCWKLFTLRALLYLKCFEGNLRQHPTILLECREEPLWTAEALTGVESVTYSMEKVQIWSVVQGAAPPLPMQRSLSKVTKSLWANISELE